MKKVITASIVLYNTDPTELQKAIDSFISIRLNTKLFIIDNSFKDDLRKFKYSDSRIEYIHNPKNLGFGSSHNIAINKGIELGSKFHFIINPDIYFEGDVITPMVKYMDNNKNIGMMMPQVQNEDGSIQYLPKLLPTPFSILRRKIKRPYGTYLNFINSYELRNVPKNIVYNTPLLSGCFTLLNLDAIKKVGVYDDKFFLYFEDWDLSRRMHQHYKTIYFPKVSVVHGYKSGANKNLKLFKVYIYSAITYFNKWGWIFDTMRKKINSKVLAQFK